MQGVLGTRPQTEAENEDRKAEPRSRSEWARGLVLVPEGAWGAARGRCGSQDATTGKRLPAEGVSKRLRAASSVLSRPLPAGIGGSPPSGAEAPHRGAAGCPPSES